MSADLPPGGAPPDPLLGRTLGGHYRLVERLGEGSVGVVYRARHTLHEEDVAVKVLRRELAADPDVRRRLLLEARSLAAFSHRHAVAVRHVGDEDGLVYLVMGLVTGESVAERLRREGPLPPSRAALLAVQALEALEEAHLAGVVHRDVKPANLMLERTPHRGTSGGERLRVVDFGLARVATPLHEGLPAALASTERRVVGTVAYMAPEQVRAEEVDGRADLFALGAVLYEMLTGERAFPGDDAVAVAARVLGAPPAPWPAGAEERIPPAVRAVVERALAKDPDLRFQSAGQMAEALREAIAAGAPPAPTRPVPGRGGRRRGARLLAALLLLGVIPGAGLALRASSRDAGAPETSPKDLGLRRLAEGRFVEAAEALSQALAQQGSDVDVLLARAAARRALRDPRAATDLAEALRLAPDSLPALVAQARHLADVEGRTADAQALLSRALLLDRSHAPAREERVRIALARRDFAGAEGDVRALLSADPEGPRSLAALARLERRRAFDQATERWDRDRLEAARRAAERAAQGDPQWAEPAAVEAGALQDLGQAARQRGEDAEADRFLHLAVAASAEALRRARAHPGYRAQAIDVPDLLVESAGIHFVRHDFAAALADLDEALRVDPRHVWALQRRAYALQQLGRHQESLAEHERLYDMAQGQEALFRVGFAWQALGMEKADRGEGAGALACFDRALATYGVGVERFPTAQEMRVYRGETLTHRAALRREEAERAADLAAARADLDWVLAHHPGDRETLLRRAEWALASGQPGAALEDARAAIGGQKDRTPRYYLTLARAALLAPEASAGEEGVAAATRALELGGPEAAAAHALRGALRVRGGDREAAAADLEALDRLASDASAPDAARARARAAWLRADLLHAGGDATGALAALREAVAEREREREAGRWSLDPTWYERLADLLEATGSPAEAAATREKARASVR